MRGRLQLHSLRGRENKLRAQGSKVVRNLASKALKVAAPFVEYQANE